MKRFPVFLVAACVAVLLMACGKKEPEPTPAPVTPPQAARPPVPFATCAAKSTLKPRPATGEKVADTDENVANALREESKDATAARSDWTGKTFEEFEASVPKECFEGGKYIVNGDVAISDVKHLREFFEERIQAPPPPPTEITIDGKKVMVSALVVGKANGEETIWNSQEQNQISYCVSDTFGDLHDKVVMDMAAASKAWTDVANVTFVYAMQHDANCTETNPNVVFDVRPVDVGGDYYARAFFPNEPRPARNVLIDLTALFLDPAEELQLVGVLRHELGHTLGFRHEHTRPQSGKCFEDNDWVPITSYDKFSVMHYPQCNGGTSWKLVLTPRDMSGAACVYGAAPGFPIDQAICQPRVIPPPPAAGPIVKAFENQTVAKGQAKPYGPFPAKPGSIARVTIKPVGPTPGDPDLYVRLRRAPEPRPGAFTCRPYLTGADETCAINVLNSPDNVVRVMVHGYTAGSYRLEVSYVPLTP